MSNRQSIDFLPLPQAGERGIFALGASTGRWRVVVYGRP